MIVRDFLKGETIVEGYIKIQTWRDDGMPIVYTEGYNVDLRGIIDNEIAYIFPYDNGKEPCICIEIYEDDI